MFNINLKNPKSLLLVAIMLVAAVGGAMAAAPTVDTETTNTASTSEITAGGTQAYNATTASHLNWSADSANSKIVIKQDNETLFTATPEAGTSVDTGTDGTADLWYYNVSLADGGSDYSGLDADAGESVTLNVTLINDTTASSPDKTNISYTFANGNAEAFEDVDETIVQTPTESGFFSVSSIPFLGDNTTDPAKADSTVGIDGNQTETVTVSVAGTPLGDALDASAETTESGDVMWGSATGIEDDYVVVANSEAPDTEWFNTSKAYATYDADSQTLTYHNVDELMSEDARDVELSATGHDGLGLGNTASMLGYYDMSGGDAYLTAVQHADWNEPDWDASDE